MKYWIKKTIIEEDEKLNKVRIENKKKNIKKKKEKRKRKEKMLKM